MSAWSGPYADIDQFAPPILRVRGDLDEAAFFQPLNGVGHGPFGYLERIGEPDRAPIAAKAHQVIEHDELGL